MLNIAVLHVYIDLYGLLLNNFQRRVLRIECTTTVRSRSTCRNIFKTFALYMYV